MLKTISAKVVNRVKSLRKPVQQNTHATEQPFVKVEQLDHVIHALHLSGDLAQLTERQVKSIVYSLQEAGHKNVFDLNANELPPIKPEQLDHIVHKLRLSNDLTKLTEAQVKNIVHEFRMAKHLQHLIDIQNATYHDGGLISFYCATDFLNNRRFAEAYESGDATNSWEEFDIRWRVYVICWAAAQAKLLDGDFVECGVNLGGFAKAQMHYIDFQHIPEKRFYLLDTFKGIPEEDKDPTIDQYYDAYSECYDEVCNTFRSFNNVNIIPGRVPDSLNQVTTDKVCYLSLDMKSVGPEIAAAEFFWDKMVPGAIMMINYYGVPDWKGRNNFDDFARKKGVEILSLPTRQGLIFKPK